MNHHHNLPQLVPMQHILRLVREEEDFVDELKRVGCNSVVAYFKICVLEKYETRQTAFSGIRPRL